MSLLVADGIRVERAGQLLVDGVSLEFAAGSAVAVVGPSGSGKTSLLAVLSGLTPPEAGTVRHDGGPADPSRIGIVLQGYGLVSLLTAAENVEVALRARGWPVDRARADTAAALASVGMDQLGEHLVEELSGGQQQRTAVARALAASPDLVIADEPTAEQDEAARAVVLDMLFTVPARGGALVLATHDPKVAERCDTRLDLAQHGALTPTAGVGVDGPAARAGRAEPAELRSGAPRRRRRGSPTPR